MDYANLAWLLLLSAIWGASYMLIKIGVAEMPPLTFAMLRVFIATLTLAGIARLRGQRLPLGRQHLRRFAVAGAFNILVPFSAISWGTQHIPSGVAAILNATMPLFVLLIAAVSGTERLTASRVAGLLAGFGGIVVLTLPRLEEGLSVSVWGSLAIVLAALSYAGATVYARRRLTGYAPLVASLGQIGTGWLMLLPLSLLAETPWHLTVSVRPILAAGALGILGTAIAYLIYYRLVGRVGATNTSLTTFIVPLFGVFWGWLILNERLSWHALAALGLILLGLLLVNGRPAHKVGEGIADDSQRSIAEIPAESAAASGSSSSP